MRWRLRGSVFWCRKGRCAGSILKHHLWHIHGGTSLMPRWPLPRWPFFWRNSQQVINIFVNEAVRLRCLRCLRLCQQLRSRGWQSLKGVGVTLFCLILRLWSVICCTRCQQGFPIIISLQRRNRSKVQWTVYAVYALAATSSFMCLWGNLPSAVFFCLTPSSGRWDFPHAGPEGTMQYIRVHHFTRTTSQHGEVLPASHWAWHPWLHSIEQIETEKKLKKSVCWDCGAWNNDNIMIIMWILFGYCCCDTTHRYSINLFV